MTTRKPTTGTPPVNDKPTDSAPATRASPGGVPAREPSTDHDVADFIAKMKTLQPVGAGRGRLVFAMDATMSRAPTWDLALQLQGEMFSAVRDVGGLDVQLVYFRGMGECRASKWVSNPDALARLMRSVGCEGGLTQIGKVLTHARDETRSRRINALVYVGDSMEENIDLLSARAGELGLLGVPVFLFQEGDDPTAALAYKEIARLTKGAYCRFDRGSARQLRDLLTAVAVYAAGGQRALLALSEKGEGGGARLLLQQLKPKASGA